MTMRFAGALMGVLLVGAAHAADKLEIKKFDSGFYDDVKIKFDGKVETVNAGPFQAVLNGKTTFDAYCVDLDHESTFGSTWDVNVLNAKGSLNNGSKVAQLYNTFSSKITNDAGAAALQLSIWDAVYAGTGRFQIVDVDSKVQAGLDIIKSINVSGANSNVGYYAALSHSGGANQNLVGGAAPVPEPASMAALGLGLLGVVRRRKAKKA